ncbi:NAD(P)-dependent oxidoreductase [Amycolatopsis sp. YIM 10]|uniref:NAD-dependent epimerase/dehydratase family protein n=1 Tax=Amycolatopsis sp. YIM 10 TaxID=2653857 RepID=UPI00128FEF83|nr:NAD(P)-dependent oxidoreductase [Amycolatopsis sp. YIM 10]QFU90492.1 NAD dependent epimerase/dehydratase family protein [Amycolatopsis sp. YIM 10]
MTRVVVLGGTGHIGGYLIPRLVTGGYEVVVVSRGRSEPYRPHEAWRSVTTVSADRDDEERTGAFGPRVRQLAPDVVIDLICFREESARQLVGALHGRIQHFLHCGTIWVHGASTRVPATEDLPRRPFGTYGIAKAGIESYLLDQARRHGFPATLLHPGHICGPGRPPVNPAGNLDLGVFRALAAGEELVLPNLGMETLHHVHADDVAQSFTAAMANRSVSIGESFHVVSPAALTLRGYAEAVAGWYGRSAELSYLGWEQWRETVDARAAELTWDHIAHSPNASIEKARRLLGFEPRYSSLDAIREAVEALAERGELPSLSPNSI